MRARILTRELSKRLESDIAPVRAEEIHKTLVVQRWQIEQAREALVVAGRLEALGDDFAHVASGQIARHERGVNGRPEWFASLHHAVENHLRLRRGPRRLMGCRTRRLPDL